jgi:anti-sigma factor RsiW
MNCPDIAELSPLYVAGELDARRATEFDGHLKTCSSCFRELETQARLDAQLRKALLAEDFDVARVNRRIREMIASDSLEEVVNNIRPVRGRWVTAAMGIAAGFLLLVAGYLLIPSHVAKVYADAAEDHQMEVVDHGPRRWLSDPAEIAALEQKLGIDVPVPSELAAGYHLERAKICRLDGRLYLHAVYSNGTYEFSLFVRSRDGEKLTGTIRGIINGRLLRGCVSGNEHLASFASSHLVAVVATDQPAAASLRYARLASAAIQD